MVSNIREKLAGLRAAPGKLSIGHAYRRGLERFVNEWPRTHMGLAAALSSLGLVYLLGFPLVAAWLLLRLPGRAMQAGGAADWLVLGGVVVLIGVLGLVSWQILRLRFELPGGEVIGQTEAPALFDTVNELCELHGSPPVHRIVLTGGFEVEVIRTPRFGFPFAFSNTLRHRPARAAVSRSAAGEGADGTAHRAACRPALPREQLAAYVWPHLVAVPDHRAGSAPSPSRGCCSPSSPGTCPYCVASPGAPRCSRNSTRTPTP
jgi:hypothetical protein